MTTLYPAAIDTFSPIPAGSEQVEVIGGRTHRAHHNDLGDAIEALEAEVGGYGTGVAGLSPLVNGMFDHWQDGTSFAAIADGTWTADQWIYRKAGAVVHTVLRSTDVPTTAQAAILASYSLYADVTTADAAIAAGDYCALATRIEGRLFRTLAAQVWSLGFWVKAAKTGRHYVYATNSGQDRSACWPYDIAVANTWEYHTAAFAASPTAGTWDYDIGRGIEIGWTLAAGATYYSPVPTSWQTGFYLAGSDQVNELDSTANDFRIALVGRPTVGLAPARCRAGDPGIELYRCRRYNETQGGAAGSMFGSGVCSATTVIDLRVPMVPKRAVSPSIGALSGTIGNLSAYTTTPIALTSLSSIGGVEDQLFIRGVVASGLVTGQAGMLYAAGTEKLRIQSRIP